MNRRVSVRYRLERPLLGRVIAAALVESCSARIQELSAHEIGLLCDRAFTPGQIVNLELPSPDQRRIRTLPIVVACALLQGASEWLVRCTFLQPPEARELRSLRS